MASTWLGRQLAPHSPSKRCRHFRFMLLIPVRVPRPEKALHSVAFPAWDHVDMQMRYALAHFVVDRNEAALGPQSALHRAPNLLGHDKQGSQSVCRNVQQRIVVLLGAHQTVPRKQWTVVQKHYRCFVFIDGGCRDRPRCDLAKYTVVQSHPVICYRTSYES